MPLGMKLKTGETVKLVVVSYLPVIPESCDPSNSIRVQGPFEFKIGEKQLTATHPDIRRRIPRSSVEAGVPIPSATIRNVAHLHVLEDQLEDAIAQTEGRIRAFIDLEVERRRKALREVEKFAAAITVHGIGVRDVRNNEEAL